MVYAGLMVAFAREMPPTLLILTAILAALCVYLSTTDFAEFRIPDSANAATFLLGIAAVFAVDPQLVLVHVIAAAVGFAGLWIIGEILFRRTGREYLGIGDAKLFGAGVMWVGPWGAPSSLLLATVTALAFALPARSFKKPVEKQSVPFGPFLAFGIFLTWLIGPIA